MPAKRRAKWTRPKTHKSAKTSTGFSDAEIEESAESFSDLAQDFVSEPTPPIHKIVKTLQPAHTLHDQLVQLRHDFGVFSRAVDDIYVGSGLEAGQLEKARLALEIFGATLDVVDSLHSLQ